MSPTVLGGWALLGLACWTAVASILTWSLPLTVAAFVIFGAGMALLALADTSDGAA